MLAGGFIPRSAIALVLSVLCFPPAALADNATPSVPTTIAGTVANHTQGAPVPGKVTVTLQVYKNQQLQTSSQTQTDGAGHYQFSGLSTDPAFQYLPVVQYQGVTYTGDAVRFADDQDDAAHDDVAVFENTAQDPG